MEPERKLRVLVVEDDADVAESLRRLLAQCGYQVAVAHTGREGLRAARQLEPHVVLCDIGLPDENGYVVGSVLRESGSHARLIAVTGRNEGGSLDARIGKLETCQRVAGNGGRCRGTGQHHRG